MQISTKVANVNAALEQAYNTASEVANSSGNIPITLTNQMLDNFALFQNAVSAFWSELQTVPGRGARVQEIVNGPDYDSGPADVVAAYQAALDAINDIQAAWTTNDMAAAVEHTQDAGTGRISVGAFNTTVSDNIRGFPALGAALTAMNGAIARVESA